MDLRLKPYVAIATGDEQGYIEVVLNANTLANIQKVVMRIFLYVGLNIARSTGLRRGLDRVVQQEYFI